MTITNLRKQKLLAASVAAGLILMFFSYGRPAFAADLTIGAASTGTVVQNSNADATAAAEFLPDLGLASSTAATLTASSTSDTTAYYGVHITSATTTGDVHWRITVNNATASLNTGDVNITEKGWFDASGHAVADSSYAPTAVGGDIVFDGNSGWNVAAGDDFTNVDEIVFSSGAPTGLYTITRELVDNTSSTTLMDNFAFTVDLMAAATTTVDTTAPEAPVVTTAPLCFATTTAMLSGTAEASSTVNIMGGGSTTTADVSGSGDWSANLTLAPDTATNFSLTSTDAASNESSSTDVVLVSDLTAPVITLNGLATMHTFDRNPFTDPGVSVSDNLDASTTVATSGDFDSTKAGTYTLTYTATDCAGNTASTSRTVIVLAASSGGGSHSGGNSSVPQGLVRAAEVASPNSAVAYVLAGFIIDNHVPGIPNTGGIGQFIRELRRGMSGDDVAELQLRLESTGIYKGPVTGYYGVLTEAAVKALQRGLGLQVTGNLDASTRAVLNNS